MSAASSVSQLVEAFRTSVVGRLVDRYTRDQCWFLAAAVAYNALFSMLPIIVLVVTLLGLALRDPDTLMRAVQILTAVLPPQAAAPVLEVVGTSAKVTGLWGAASLLGLVWVGVGFFIALEEALDRVYSVGERSFVAQRLMGLAMIAIFAVLIVLQIAAVAVAQLVVHAATLLPLVGPTLAQLIPVAGYLVSAAAAFLLCLTVFYVVPNLRLTLRETLPGTLFATVALVILAQGFPLYVRLSGGAGQYGQVFGLALLLMTWSYLVAHAFIVGAELNVILRDGASARPRGAAGEILSGSERDEVRQRAA